MKRFISRHRGQIIFAILLSLLFFFLIPSEEERYFRSDLKDIERTSEYALIWTEAALALLLMALLVRKAEKISNIVVSFVVVLFSGLTIFLVLNPIAYYATLFVNKTITKQHGTELYTVSMMGESMLLLSNSKKTLIYDDPVVKQAEQRNLKWRDTVIVEFKTGLFGYDFDPQIREVIHYSREGDEAKIQ